MTAPAAEPSPTRPVLRLAMVSVAALFVFYLIDTRIFVWAHERAPLLGRLADLRITSLAAIGTVYALTASRLPLRPSRPSGTVLRVVAIWLLGTFVCVHFFGIGRVPLPRLEDRVAFALTGSLGEELLCRGLVLGLALVRWPASQHPRRALVFSSVVFAAMHLQYHHFDLGAAYLQMAWTLPAGYVFGLVALRTRSVGVAWIVHVINNLIVLFA